MGFLLVLVFWVKVIIWVFSWLSDHWYLLVPVFGLLIWRYARYRRIRAERRRREQAKIDRENRERERKTTGYQDVIAASGIKEIDSWSVQDKGTMFEDRMAVHFEYFGCTVKKTKLSGDFGADLVVHNPRTRKSSAIQCKCYNPKRKVSVSAVQEAISGMHHYKTHHAMVITNVRLTKNALQLAKTANVYVWERDKLIERLAKEHETRQANSQIDGSTPLLTDC